jgi:hypothetical protein
MDIIEKLKKEKKIRSVFDIILKGKETEADRHEKSPDIEVRELSPAAAAAAVPQIEQAESEPGPDEHKPIREFRTEGMHEFDIDSLGASGHGALKVEYKARLVHLVDEGKIDEAIEVLKELKKRLSEPRASDEPTPSGETEIEI